MTVLTRNSTGFTLIEVMVAIVIMMVGMMGLLTSIDIATEVNLKNHLRDEAVYAGEKYLNEMKGKGFDALAPASPATLLAFPVISTASKVRGTGKKLMVETNSTVLSRDPLNNPTTLQLQVVVKWTYKGVGYENRVTAPFSAMPK